MNERGSALIAALGIALLLLPLGAFVVMQCRTDLLIQHNLRAETEAFYVAEAGLEHALSDIDPDSGFAQLVAGPDRQVGTADDGVFPFREGVPAEFPSPPFRYEVRVIAAGPGAVQLVSTGTGGSGARRVVSARVTRAALPFTPAALYVAGDFARSDFRSDNFEVSGTDHRLGDLPASPSGPAATLPGICTPDDDATARLRERITRDGSTRVAGTGAAPSLATVAPLDLRRYVSALGAQAPVVVDPAAATANLQLGTPDAPQLSVARGDLEIAGTCTGAGVLVVDGSLRVTGSLTFAGLMIVMGGVVFDTGSAVAISGAVWRGGPDDRLQLRGRGALLYSSQALSAADRSVAGVLPHAVVATAWQELF